MNMEEITMKEVYYLKNAIAKICSFTEPAREIRF